LLVVVVSASILRVAQLFYHSIFTLSFPLTANPQLGTWVHTQRRQYKLMIEGKKSSMTQEKAQALDSIGFFWAAKPSSRSVNRAEPVQHDVIGQPAPLNNAMGFVQQK